MSVSHSSSKELLAFCHIEKAAGTSLIHVLRRIFFLRYAAVRPMNSCETDFFTARDFKTMLKFNPFLGGFGGHSVVPHSDLVDSARIKFITQVREPIARAASHYKYWVNRMALNTTWEDFLKHPASKNFQVKKLAGCESLDLAKKNILQYFLLVGTVNQFDTFLVLLAQKLGMPFSMFTYDRQNVDNSPRSVKLPQEFFDGLHDRNRLDCELYEWVENILFPGYIAEYPGAFTSDLAEFRLLQDAASRARVKPAIDFIYRNAYLKPVSGITRVLHGLPYQGSYSTR